MRNFVWILVASSWLFGCGQSGSSTGNPDERDCVSDAQSMAGLYDVEVTELSSDDEETAFGVSASEVLAYADGKHAASLAWNDWREQRAPSADEEDTVEIRVTRRATAPRLVDYTWLDPSVAPGRDQIDRLEIDVRVALSVGRAGIEIAADGVLRADAHGFVRLGDGCHADGFSPPVTAEDLAGLERIDPAWTDPAHAELWLWVSFVEERVSGHLSLRPALESGDSGQQLEGHFPADNPCGPTSVPILLSETTFGASVEQAMTWAAAAPAREVAWGDGTTTTLSVQRADLEPWACASGDSPLDGGYRLESRGTVEARTADGKLTLATQAFFDTFLRLDGSVLRHDSFVAVGLPGAPLPANELEEHITLQGLDVSSLDEGGWVFFADYVADDEQADLPVANGALRVGDFAEPVFELVWGDESSASE